MPQKKRDFHRSRSCCSQSTRPNNLTSLQELRFQNPLAINRAHKANNVTFAQKDRSKSHTRYFHPRENVKTFSIAKEAFASAAQCCLAYHFQRINSVSQLLHAGHPE